MTTNFHYQSYVSVEANGAIKVHETKWLSDQPTLRPEEFTDPLAMATSALQFLDEHCSPGDYRLEAKGAIELHFRDDYLHADISFVEVKITSVSNVLIRDFFVNPQPRRDVVIHAVYPTR